MAPFTEELSQNDGTYLSCRAHHAIQYAEFYLGQDRALHSNSKWVFTTEQNSRGTPEIWSDKLG
jgi:hypothetical protein